MRIAIMQPYFFPYIGYFQLVNAVDVFIFYDDVNFIKGGWINRNNIIVNRRKKLISIPLKKQSPNQLIKQINIDESKPWKKKILKTLKVSYAKAPYIQDVYPLFEDVLYRDTSLISEMCATSIMKIANYLNLKVHFFNSSNLKSTSELGRSDRLIAICKELNANHYINSIGGIELYNKSYFEQNGISLSFIEPELFNYSQFNGQKFIPGLSIIDILMFNPIAEVKKMINGGKLI